MTVHLSQLTAAERRIVAQATKRLGRWHQIDSGHWTAPLGGPSPVLRALADVIWRHFPDDPRLASVELTAVKRQRLGVCAPHTDTDMIGSRGRLWSMSVGMSDNHTGGLLIVDGEPVDLRTGLVATFPSNARHEVTAVTTGVRLALVARALDRTGWAAGRLLWPRTGPPRRCPPAVISRRDVRRHRYPKVA